MTDGESLPPGGPLPVPYWYAGLTLLVVATALVFIGFEAAYAPPSGQLDYRPIGVPTDWRLQSLIAVLGTGGYLLARRKMGGRDD